MQSLVEGQTLLHNGRYRFLRRIGCGTFAVIMRAVDMEQQRHVAIKCIRQQQFNALGEREAIALQRISELDVDTACAVVRLLATFEEQGHFCLVLELLGPSVLDVTRWGPWRQAPGVARAPDWTIRLFRRKQRRVSLPPLVTSIQSPDEMETAHDIALPLSIAEVRQIAVHLCGTLAFLHDQGLIHADVKPENVVRANADDCMEASSFLMPCSSPVKLVDFGNFLDMSELAAYTAERTSGGFDVQTITYRAPEVAAGLLLCPAMDMWSLGCLLLECVSSKPLFMLSTLDVSVYERGDIMRFENDHLLHQIENIVMNGVPLVAVHAPYRSAARYNETTAIAELTSKQAPSTLLQARLEAAAPENNQFKDFIYSLLDVNPDTRITAKKALYHPFLQAFFPFKTVFGPLKAGKEREHAKGNSSAVKACTERKAKRFGLREAEVQERIGRVRKKKLAKSAASARKRDLRQVLRVIPRDVDRS